jgi:exopolysaccharide production protein ExoZ
MARHELNRDGKLLGIQAARGVAALLVLVFHAERALSLPQYVGRLPLDGVTGFGHTGVDFFFVLSGFIIYSVHNADIGQPRRLGHYAGRRISRIFPPYWVVTAGVLLITLAGHGWDGLPGWPDAAASLLLVPHGTPPIVGVAWTLEREMIFYVLFGLAILSRPLALVAVAAWAGLTCTSLLLPGSGLHLGPLALGTYDLQFAIGLATAWVLRRPGPARSGLTALAGLAAFLGAGIAENMGALPHEALVSRMAYGIASAVIILGLVGMERQGRLHVGKFMVLLGAASYSLYLVHLTPLTLTVRGLAVAGVVGLMPGWLVMAICCSVAVIVSITFHKMVELPLTRAAQRLATRVFTPGSTVARVT